MIWHVTVPNTYAEFHIVSTAITPGAAAHKTAQNKIDKYFKLACSTHILFILFINLVKPSEISQIITNILNAFASLKEYYFLHLAYYTVTGVTLNVL